MPEGDTIHRAADRLRPALAGKALARLSAPYATGRPPAPGTRIIDVEARGKHLRVRFADGTALRTHLRMTGSWHLYRTGERWRKPRPLARAVLEVDGWVAVCFAAPLVAFERDDAATAHLGPDLTSVPLADSATNSVPRTGAGTDSRDDLALAVARLRTLPPATPIAVALLDQRVAAGVGNIYKSEALFTCGIDPRTPIESLGDPAAHRLLRAAARLLQAPTRPGAVYRRAGQPCRRCGTPIRVERGGVDERDSRRQGEVASQARSTYWCPTCQPRR